MIRPEQLVLATRSRIGWGGNRPGGGRRRGAHPRVRHRPRPSLDGRSPCHVTLRVCRGVPSLRSRCLVAELEKSFRQARERGGFRVVHYSIQVDHVHLVVEADDSAALGRGMMSVAARLARAVNRTFKRTGKVLADHYHLHVLRTPSEVRNAIAYVLLNARKHALAAGRALATTLGRVDPASSSRWFEGWRERRPAAHDPPAVAPPLTWMLRVGWMRHGLISVDECPGRAVPPAEVQ